MPHRTDNALVKAAEVVRRIAAYAPEARIHHVWRRFVEGLDLPEELSGPLLDPAGVEQVAETYPDLGLARMVHACTHTTLAPTVMHGGVKTNVIPDHVELQVDIRTLPGDRGQDVRAMLDDALGDLRDSVEISAESDDAATESPVETPLWDSLQRVTSALAPGSTNVPMIITGATDARFFRRKGITAYGAGLFSERLSFAEFIQMFHGNDERVDIESLRLSTELWEALARDLLG
jgi:acetylornithine deacetylase/succinyl-diaminopimelate desuccinylase-like protein